MSTPIPTPTLSPCHTPLPLSPSSPKLPISYGVSHQTAYTYTSMVSQSWQLARLTPRCLPWQSVLSCVLQVEPTPDEFRQGPDCFGNTVTHFGIYSAHRSLTVRMQSVLDVGPRPTPALGPQWAWEQVRAAAQSLPVAADTQVPLMTFSTHLLPPSQAAQAYAALSLTPGRDWLQALIELMHRIHDEFEFDPTATTVSTSVDEVLSQRRGVCQDFAHLMLAGLRSHGLPARYVSGYLLTDAPQGQPRLMGVDASHAWVAAYCPALGWVEFDPTNRQLADQRYITLAWGRDFADVVPVTGVIHGGDEQELVVGVNVQPLGCSPVVDPHSPARGS